MIKRNSQIVPAFIHQMPSMKKRTKKTIQRSKKSKSFTTRLNQSQIASRSTKKQTSNNTTIKKYPDNKFGIKRGVRKN